MILLHTTCTALLALGTWAAATDRREDQTQLRQGTRHAHAEPMDGNGVGSVKADRIVVYSAAWCVPCQRLKPVIASLKRDGYKVDYVDIDRDVDTLKYEHKSVPTIYFLRGDDLVKKATGYRSKDEIVKMLIPNRDHSPRQVGPTTESTGPATRSRQRIGRF